jgi:hypothetical protein
MNKAGKNNNQILGVVYVRVHHIDLPPTNI